MVTQPNFAVAIPVYRGARYADALVKDIAAQDARPAGWIVIDSTPDDSTARAFGGLGVPVERIEPRSFDHGGTRNLALQRAAALKVDIVIFMTQDVRLAGPDSFGHLLRAFADPEVGAAFGRQLPRAEAGPVERANRVVRYPAESYRTRSLSGSRRYFMSNAWAAYRVEALREVGGFPAPSIFGEDAAASWRIQEAGWDVAYAADACALHSHAPSLTSEFRRFFDVGVALRQPSTPASWGSKGDGAANTVREIKTAFGLGGPFAAIGATTLAVARAVGLLAGQWRWIPPGIGVRLSYSPSAYRLVVGA